jgi:hypothetical protein
MISLIALAALCSRLDFGTPLTRREAIVISATRYRMHLDNVYVSGSSHLYYLEADGSGLKQLTNGEQEDLWPTPSLDQKHILFWRHSAKDDDEEEGNRPDAYVLYSVGLDGKGLRQLWKSDGGGDGFAHTFERFGKDPIREVMTSGNGVNDASNKFYDVKGNQIPVNLILDYSSDGLYSLGNFDPDAKDTEDVAGPRATSIEIYDLKEGNTAKLDPKFISSVFVGDDVLAMQNGDPYTLVLLDHNGHELQRRKFDKKVMDPDEEDSRDELWGPPLKVDAYPLWAPGIFIVKGHHQMSDGGYDYSYRVNLGTGKMEKLQEEGVEAVSSNGQQFLTTHYNWVGGYKGAGAAKLCKLYLTNAKTLEQKAVGFKLMTVGGACFVPSVRS